MRAWLAAGAVALLLAGCRHDEAQSRARAAAERVRHGLTDDGERALAQRVPAQQVRAAQQALSVLSEYYGEIDGVLDPVTVNAVQAFQRRAGLEPDGLLTAETQRRLQATAAQAVIADEPTAHGGAGTPAAHAGGVNRSTPPM